jgi:hypothetical protein
MIFKSENLNGCSRSWSRNNSDRYDGSWSCGVNRSWSVCCDRRWYIGRSRGCIWSYSWSESWPIDRSAGWCCNKNCSCSPRGK